MRQRRLGVAFTAGLALCVAGLGARAETDSERALAERVQGLEQQLAILERKLELKDEAAAAKSKDAPQIGAGPDGFFLSSGDKKFVLRLRGYLQADSRWFEEGREATSGSDTFLLRRVRPIVEGTLFEKIDFRIMPDFGQGKAVLYDAWVNLRYFELAQLQAGKFKPPFGLERLASATNLLFVERGLPSELVPTRDTGLMLQGSWERGLLSYQVGAFNGVNDGGNGDNDTNGGKDVFARIFAHPFRTMEIPALEGLGLGIAASYGNAKGSTPTPGYQTAGREVFFKYRSSVAYAGDRVRFSPQAYYYYGPFGLLAEYVQSITSLERGSESLRPTAQAWQVAASWVLTGEDASYRGVNPRNAFTLGGAGWGAFELATRVGQLMLDRSVYDGGTASFADPAVAARGATAWTVGLNWYLNLYVKFVLDYDRTSFSGGAADGGDRPTEGTLATRIQFSY